MKILIVTPCRNESQNLAEMVASLEEQDSTFISGIIFVENNSTDNTFEVASQISEKSGHALFPIHALTFREKGNLFNAVELQAFVYGVNQMLGNFPEVTHVMKLDADVRLSRNYFSAINILHQGFDLAGGTLENEQSWNVPGCVKLYSKRALDLVFQLPPALGWDVIDEVHLRRNGQVVSYCVDAKFQIARVTGSSEGLLRGRWRLGIVCRYTGYTRLYFFLKFIRFLFRKPFVLGSFAMLFGYLGKRESPFSQELIDEYQKDQRGKLLQLLRNPVGWLSKTYRMGI
jgi:dolichol-phosphate mannosyltransferase